ncbi:MAG: hemolysin family protein [Chloroflexota bacterium]|nr:hemolysin family protein [Chloroflexota bacterium]MDQ5867640.1 hemolysin family protein [Chloroflexota bacterium]
MAFGLILTVVLVLVTAFFVAAEFAFVSIRRTRVDQLASEGSGPAKDLQRALHNLNTYLAAAQIGITMATLGLGALGEPVVAAVIVPPLEAILPHEWVEQFVSIHGIAFVIALLLVTIVELIYGETVPKIFGIQRAEAVAMAVIRPMNLMLLVFKPLIWIINTFSNATLRLLGLPQDQGHETAYSVEELEMLVVSSRKAGVLDREEEAILRNVFDFGDLTARQVMLPRTELIGLPVDATLQEVLQTMVEHRYSRFPVYEHDLDSIVGVVHVRDMFIQLAEATGISHSPSNGDGGGQSWPTTPAPDTLVPALPANGHFSVRDLMRPINAVPETIDVDELLTFMQKQGVQIVLVVDEYGGTAGIVTMEDIVEEIVGEVRGEFDTEDQRSDFTVTPEGMLIDGLVPIDDVNETLGLHIETEATTLGGYVFELLGRKPELGDEVETEGTLFRVEELDGLRIATVRALLRRHPNSSPNTPTPQPAGVNDEEG